MKPRHALSAVLGLSTMISVSVPALQPNAATSTRMVTIDGHAMRVQILGLETRKAGAPVVVFEAGASNALEVWGGIPAQIAAAVPVVAYDRAGLGRSAWDSAPPTPQHVTRKLRRLLGVIGVEPPYVLVGYSWGGALMRYFAGYHPRDVAGVVYVDPGPIVTQTLTEALAPFNAVGGGRAGYDTYWSALGRVMQRASPAARAEYDVFSRLLERDVAERDLRPMPNVPVVVLIAAKYLDLSQAIQVPFDQRAQFEADVRHRVKLLQEWALASTGGTLVVSNQTTHMMPREDPDLIVWAIKRVLSAVQNRP
jgi:pimeloyl-ACP methyl ester carboxylesterase